MPRPKVRPENRLRSSRACDLCKASKIRCDARIPCAACVKRNRPNDCNYGISRSRRARPQTGDGALASTPPALPQLSQGGWIGSPEESNHSQSPLIAQPSPQSTKDGGDESIKDGDQDSPSEKFITGSNGENLYIGDTASLSFLDFLRHALRPYVGTTCFTDGERQNLMLELDVDDSTNTNIDLTTQEKESLVHSYSEATSAILCLFSPAEIETLEGKSLDDSSQDMKKIDRAALDMILAIGAQARASDAQDAQCAAVYFARARSVAFEGMLADPSISMVRLFLLLAFFTLGACRQNAAFIYLGVASKAAIVLGLHQPMSWRRLQKQAEWPSLRLRIWHSLCTLDVLTSSLLGRPCTVPRATRHDLHALPLDPNTPAFNAVLKGAALLDDICGILSRGVMIDVPTAEDLLKKLRRWSQDLPPCLRQFSCPSCASMSSVDRQTFLGRIHMSSVYYFSVMLVTRPFLIRYSMAKIRRRSGHNYNINLHPDEASLAQVCLSSAAYMGDLARKTGLAVMTSELPFGNLCLFTAWTFGAGLILGLSLFASESGTDIQESFKGILEMLNKIGEASPQSRLYSETLGAFMDTISAYRRQSTHKSRHAVDQYIDQILTIDIDPDQSGQETASSSQYSTTFSWDTDADFHTAFGSVDPTLGGQSGLEDYWSVQQDWDDIAMQFSDNFGIDFGAQML
ncbi:uncharacterized protein N7459_005998 [Penicillium hispanicum]|uniref:uncharacterized protein n=1 Tax=Penicillium hispanicum TaxID=1080232 RepID=UPI002541DA36|nr:uncharacterized protein N7459_005998 [Penicillium hispanicum]KAJ5580013.1 hypothetical protein N7459_005998 [Penicillium hispanicum]